MWPTYCIGLLVTTELYSIMNLNLEKVCLPVCPSICLSICLSVCLSTCLSVYLSVCLSLHWSICLLGAKVALTKKMINWLVSFIFVLKNPIMRALQLMQFLMKTKTANWYKNVYAVCLPSEIILSDCAAYSTASQIKWMTVVDFFHLYLTCSTSWGTDGGE